jgi:hypothetical protein
MSKSKSNVWNTAPVPCNQCGRFYRADLISKCPGCAAKNLPTTPNIPKEFSRDETTLKDLVRAQNRTTHAVRAFVRFLFIQLSGITLAVFLWNLSLLFVDEEACFQSGDKCSGNIFLQFLAGIVWVVAVILSSREGWDELNKSNVD